MEDSLGDGFLRRDSISLFNVLILVVVEDSLGDRFKFSKCKDDLVLILVVVEDSLGDLKISLKSIL